MTCEHLRALEQAIQAAGLHETFRGQAWSDNCREWVYFDCWIDLDGVRLRHSLPECVRDHVHRGTHDGESAASSAPNAMTRSWEATSSGPVSRHSAADYFKQIN